MAYPIVNTHALGAVTKALKAWEIVFRPACMCRQLNCSACSGTQADLPTVRGPVQVLFGDGVRIIARL